MAVRVADTQSEEVVHYMPHQSVIRESGITTNGRVVFDASFHDSNITSLNNFLKNEPNLNLDNLELLFNFRRHKIALIEDMQYASLRIRIGEKDPDALRFLLFYEVPLMDTSNIGT